jgi:hypothetical protein
MMFLALFVKWILQTNKKICLKSAVGALRVPVNKMLHEHPHFDPMGIGFQVRYSGLATCPFITVFCLYSPPSIVFPKYYYFS